MRQAADGVHGARMRALIVLLWRAGFPFKLADQLAVPEAAGPASRRAD
jgi:hypothetical protein